MFIRLPIWSLLVVVLFVSGCANRTTQAILDPKYQSGQYTQFNQSVSLNIIDQRAKSATISVAHGDERFLMPTQGLDSKMFKVFEQALKVNGAQVSALATSQLQVSIHSLNATVTQNTIDHVSEAQIALQVFVNRNGSQFSKMYNGQSQFRGPFGYDQAKVEAQLNKLIEQLVTRIMSDPELNNYMQKGAS
ncbi:YajG family lipoprotein [Pseudoalteromonas sp. SSDWG2]|uniref:YajG family lipoprotein n=1 Tax=Pseudoalteromonas sp. SSDWG2 TaxID=3139391 RepID=UPI003BA9E7E9